MIRLTIILALTLSSPALAETITGTARVGDGGSFRVAGSDVRLFGIDAPEYEQTCQANYSAWTCGQDAASALRSLIDNRPITCIPRDKDVYGRTVANCLIDGQDVAGQMVTRGFAIVLENGQSDYAVLQARAKASKNGIWASKFDMPVDWRRTNSRQPDKMRSATSTRSFARVRSQTQGSGFMYRSCAQARAAGAAPMYRGQPGYNPNLDGDNDGISCEPYHGRR